MRSTILITFIALLATLGRSHSIDLNKRPDDDSIYTRGKPVTTIVDFCGSLSHLKI
jgi:hypothetical protein